MGSHEETAMTTRKRQCGMTWVETAVVMAVVAVVTSQAAPSMARFVDARRLEGVATQIATDLQSARIESVARNQAIRLTLQQPAQGSCYVIHTGLAAQCMCAIFAPTICTGDAREIRTIALPAGDGVSLAANTASILFDPLHGTSTPSATFRVLGRHGRAVHHVVNVMGRVRSCSPAGGVAGYPSC
jgi:type IV fimbrial biogenesis protein FimT